MEEKKILYGRRLRRLEDGRLVKTFIAEKMKGWGNVNWWGSVRYC